MERNTWLIVGMWVAALVAILVVVFRRDAAEAPAPDLETPGAPVYVSGEPEADAPSESREHLEVARVPEGPSSTFRGDRRHTGRSAYLGPSASNVAWTFETHGRITAQPVVGADNRIYVASHDHFIYALTEFGTQVWKRDLGGFVYSTPYVDGSGNVYVGSDSGAFFALDDEGNIKWRLPTESDADTGAVAAPDGTIHFAAGVHLYAIEPSGTVKWRFEARAKIFTTPAVDDDGTIYIGSQDDQLYAIASDGRERWSYRTGGDNDSSPVIGDDGTIYFGSDDHHVYALSRDGALKWSKDLEGMVRAPIGLTQDGAVLAGVFGPRPRVVCIDPGGDTRWFFPVTVAESTEIGVSSGPLVDRDGNIYFGAHDDYLYALNPNGQLRWVFQTAGDVDANPTLTAQGALLVGSDDMRLYALQAAAP